MKKLFEKRQSGIAKFLVLAATTVFSTPLLLESVPTASAQSAPSVALITRSLPIPAADQEYVNQMSNRGWNVIPIDDDEIRDYGRTAISGYDLVVISSTTYPARVSWKLRSAPEPIIVAEHELFDNFHLTAATNTSKGLTSESSTISIVNSGSPLAAGLSGNVIVSAQAEAMNFGKAGSDANVVATANNAANEAVIFSYDTGDTLASGESAAGPRVGFFMNQAIPRLATNNSWELLDAAGTWAMSVAPTSTENFVAFEETVGRELEIINRFHEFSAGLESTFFWDRQHIEAGRTVMVSWRATDNAGSTSGQPDPQRAQKIVDGNFDAQINAMAEQLRDLNAPILLRFNWEMDQDLGDPQNIGSPSEFIAAWRYVHGKFQQAGATNVEWVWAPRARSFAKDVGPTFYPGDQYVDWVGGSAVPITSFTSAETIYTDWNAWASNRGKPQLLWVGLRENPDDGSWKAGFIDDLRTLTTGPWSGVKAIVYYHSFSPKGYDYWIDTSSQSLNAFRNLSCHPHYTSNGKSC